MPVRETSIESFKRLIASGQLGKEESRVLSAYLVGGPATARENDRRCGVFEQEKQRSLQPVITRLVDKGLMTELGKRQCREMGNKVLVFGLCYDWTKARDKAPRMTAKDWRAALEATHRALELAQARGFVPPPEQLKMLDYAFYKGWEGKIRDKKTGGH